MQMLTLDGQLGADESSRALVRCPHTGFGSETDQIFRILSSP